ncbi:hypothetical protein [Bradyrhizobium embrapense]
MAVGEVDRHRNPLPAFGGDLFGFQFQLVGDKAVQQGNVLQMSAIVMLEQITQNAAVSLLFAVTRIGTSRPVGRFTIAEMIGPRFG